MMPKEHDSKDHRNLEQSKEVWIVKQSAQDKGHLPCGLRCPLMVKMRVRHKQRLFGNSEVVWTARNIWSSV